jgi:DNA-binding beta-propeller fold protein YncE
MTTVQRIIKNKLGLLKLAQTLGNISEACKVFVCSRDSFYRFKDLLPKGGTTTLTRLILTLVSMVLSVSAFGQSGPGYHVAKKSLIGGEGFWDYMYVDSEAQRLYVSHGDHVVVLNADNLDQVGEIPHTEGVHGIAVARDFGHGFTSNGRTSTVTMFDLGTLKVLRTVPVSGKNPDAILYDPGSRRVFTFNGRSGNATVLKAETGDTVGTIELGGKPEFAVTDLLDHVYVNIEDKSEIAAIDTRTMKVDGRWSISPGEEPAGLAIDRVNRRLFSTCRNKMMVISDPDARKVVSAVPIGEGTDGCMFDPMTNLAFSSNGEGTISVVHEDSPAKFSLVETDTTLPRARTMTIDPTTHALFTATAEFGPRPAPTAENPRPRPPMLPNTFVVIKLEPAHR